MLKTLSLIREKHLSHKINHQNQKASKQSCRPNDSKLNIPKPANITKTIGDTTDINPFLK